MRATRRRRLRAIRMVVAATLVLWPAAAVVAAGPGYPPIVLVMDDLTGDGVVDLVVAQSRAGAPADGLFRLVDGSSGAVVWQDVVARPITVDPVSLGPGAKGIALVSRVAGGPTDLTADSLRVRVVDGSGRSVWERAFAAETLVPALLPSYVRPAPRHVLTRAGRSDALLVQSDVRVEAAAGQVTRTTAHVLDAATGESLAEHGPIDTLNDLMVLVPMPDAGGDGVADIAAVTYPAGSSRPGRGTLRALDAVSGEMRWTADVVASRDVEVHALTAGDPPVPVVSVASRYPGNGGGVQLLDLRTGEPRVVRERGDFALFADGTGEAGRIRATHLTFGQDVEYYVDILDLQGNVVRTAQFPVGVPGATGYRFAHFQEAGDVNRDGWLDLLVHVWARSGTDEAYDDRIVDGRTLASRTVRRDLTSLVWTGAGSAAVDGAGDDVVVRDGRTARVLDGLSGRALLDVEARDPISGAFGMRDDAAACADVVVVAYRDDDFGVARVGPRGEVRWSTGIADVTASDLAGNAACARVEPASAGRDAGRAIPATGGLPRMMAAVVVAASAAVTFRWRVRAVG